MNLTGARGIWIFRPYRVELPTLWERDRRILHRRLDEQGKFRDIFEKRRYRPDNDTLHDFSKFNEEPERGYERKAEHFRLKGDWYDSEGNEWFHDPYVSRLTIKIRNSKEDVGQDSDWLGSSFGKSPEKVYRAISLTQDAYIKARDFFISSSIENQQSQIEVLAEGVDDPEVVWHAILKWEYRIIYRTTA